jgi:hypothetical protein
MRTRLSRLPARKSERARDREPNAPVAAATIEVAFRTLDEDNHGNSIREMRTGQLTPERALRRRRIKDLEGQLFKSVHCCGELSQGYGALVEDARSSEIVWRLGTTCALVQAPARTVPGGLRPPPSLTGKVQLHGKVQFLRIDRATSNAECRRRRLRLDAQEMHAERQRLLVELEDLRERHLAFQRSNGELFGPTSDDDASHRSSVQPERHDAMVRLVQSGSIRLGSARTGCAS